MSLVRRKEVAIIFCILLLLPLFNAVTAEDEIVAFNTNTHKYHCLTCEWAIKCTKNCIKIKKSEAVKRGGVPCKICGGTCPK